MTTLVGTAIAATFAGSMSDKLGRRPLMLVCVAFGVIGSIAKYGARGSFWAFCAVNFVTGLFGATLAISMAYASDVAYTRAEKDTLIGSLVGLYMVGNTGGGVISIAMEGTGLFASLFVGAALNLVVTIFSYFFLIEPNKMLHMGAALEDDDDGGPEKIDWKVTSNILAGSLADNAGSVGLFPLCLSPLAFNFFYTDFLAAGLAPLMTANAFKWISTLIALMIVPAAMSSSKVYEWIGAAGLVYVMICWPFACFHSSSKCVLLCYYFYSGCVAGNFFTAIMTIAMLQIVLITPATNSTYAGFVTLLYAGFPFTMISQLSTGPMLDMIAPADKRGLTQGLNQTVMSLGSAVFPWLFGILADEIGTETTIWITVGVSLSAVLINSPLLFEKALQRKKAIPDYSRHIEGEDKDIVERVLAGERVSAKSLRAINIRRMDTGHHFLAIPNRTFEEDKPILQDIKNYAQEDFAFFKSDIAAFIGSADMSDTETRHQIAEKVKKARIGDEERALFSKGMGSWFADYLVSAGYRVEESPMLFKQMMMSAFPVISKEQDVTAENVEQILLNLTKVVDGYLEEDEAPDHMKAWARGFI